MGEFITSLVETFKENIPAQIIGIFAMAAVVLSYQFNKQKSIIAMQFVGCVLFTVHMFMLGAVSGGIINALGACSTAVFYFRNDKNRASSILWPVLFITLGAVLNVVFWDGAMSLLPVFAFASTRIGLSSGKPFLTRMLGLPSSVLFIIYNLHYASYAGFVTEVIAIISITVGFLRYDIPKKQ